MEEGSCPSALKTRLIRDGELTPQQHQLLSDAGGGGPSRCAQFTDKLESWDCVRVALSIPQEAASRLRQLATTAPGIAGPSSADVATASSLLQQLRALGILSVQLDGEQVVPLTPPTSSSAATTNASSAVSSASISTVPSPSAPPVKAHHVAVPQVAQPSQPQQQPHSLLQLQVQRQEKVQFRSPNVVCPSDSIVPKVPVPSGNNTPPVSKVFAGPFPFTSMNQARHVTRDTNPSTSLSAPNGPSVVTNVPAPPVVNSSATSASFVAPPPPYPGKHPPIVQQTPSQPMSSPLLVNLLNEGSTGQTRVHVNTDDRTLHSMVSNSTKMQINQQSTIVQQQAIMRCNQPIVQQPMIKPTHTKVHYNNVTRMPSVAPPPHQIPQVPATNKLLKPGKIPMTVTNNSGIIQQQQITPTPMPLSRNPVPYSNPPPYPGVPAPPRWEQPQPHPPPIPVPQSQPPIQLIPPPQPSPSSLLPNLDLAATLTDLKFSDLDQLLNFDRDIASPGDLPDVSLDDLQIPTPPSLNNGALSTILNSASCSTNIAPLNVAISNSNLTNHVAGGSIHTGTHGSTINNIRQNISGSNDVNNIVNSNSMSGFSQQTDKLKMGASSNSSSKKSGSDFLINPFTGELEQKPVSDSEEEVRDVFVGLPSPTYFSDEDTNSTIRPDTTTDQSDSESRSGYSDSGKHSSKKQRRDKGSGGRSAATAGSTNSGGESPKPTEKIKLRLKLEKSEPVNAAYKVEMSYVNASASNSQQQQIKKAITATPSSAQLSSTTTNVVALPASSPSGSEELRVPPLHISLRGKTHAVINNKKKQREKQKSDEEERRLKKPKLDEESSNHKLKERRGSDSELPKIKKYPELNGTIDDKKRRLSQSDETFDVVGSKNTGTVAYANTLAAKRKNKLKTIPKGKELNRDKSYSKNIAEKQKALSGISQAQTVQPLAKQISLPTGEIDNMEAKIKQRLLEDTITLEDTPAVLRDPKVDDLLQTLEDHKEKPSEPDKCNTPDKQDKQGRSPNSGAQGEDSGIESMDALSEKSPNQASQSPHTEINPEIKKPAPDMILDIEAQLAKMEGEDIQEENHNNTEKLEQCCVLPVVKPVDVKEEPLPLRVNPPLYTYSNVEKKEGEEETNTTVVISNEVNGEDFLVSNNSKKSLLEQLLIDIPENQPNSPNMHSPATRSVRTRASSKLNSPELTNSPAIVPAKTKPAPTTKRKRLESDSSDGSTSKKVRKVSESSLAATNAAPVTATITSTPTAATSSKATPVLNNNKKPAKKSLEESSDSDEPLIEVAGKARKNTNTTKVKAKANVTINSPLTTTSSTQSIDNSTTPAPVSILSATVDLTNESSPQRTTVMSTSSMTAATTVTTSTIASASITTTASTTISTTATQVNSSKAPARRSIRSNPAQAPAVVNTRSKGDKSNPDSDVIRRKTRSAVSEGEGKRRKELVK